MKRMIVLAMMLVLVGCQGPQIKTASTWELIDKEPMFEMMTTVKDASGYELTIVKTFQRQSDGGVKMIDARQVGGPGLGYALANTGLEAAGEVVSAGLVSWAAIEAAEKIRPDNTNVVQEGGGATVKTSVTAEGGAGGKGGAGGNADAVSRSTAEGGTAVAGAAALSVSSATARQNQGQGQAQGQLQGQTQGQDQDQEQAQTQR